MEKEDKKPSNGEWNQVSVKRKNKPRTDMSLPIRAMTHYWQGFYSSGRQKWFIELNDGRILTEEHEEYDFWVRRFYPNNRRRN